jgi:predicted FMN-binding regulatory protein PaiB
MIYYDIYGATDEAVDQFVREVPMGRLVTVGADGAPHIGLYPFAIGAEVIELHLNKDDEQLVDLRSNVRCLFEVDEILAVIPSYWVHPENAVMATAYHRTVVFECTGTTSADPEMLAERQNRIMERYQPDGGYRPVSAADPLYEGMVAMLEVVTLEVVARRAKFKLAQNRTTEVRTHIIDQLRSRGRLSDDRAADALQWALDRD